MPSNTLQRAEKRALDGKNESQDTLVVFDHLMRDYGVGITSSSPPPEDCSTTPPPSKPVAQKDLGRPKKPQSFSTRGTAREGNTNSQPRPQHRPVAEKAPPQGPETGQAPGSDGTGNGLTDIPPNQLNTVRREKMDSQKSTQSNHGRSYDQYCRSPSPGLDTRARDAEDAETAQFNFDKINGATPHNGSHLPDDSGFVDFGLSRLGKHASHQPILSSPHPPETPAPPQNPFRHSRSQLLPPSQLFQSTQFSSAVKVASPTSSRPSPAEFPHPALLADPATSSPLKNRGLRSSSVLSPPSSPQVLPGTRSSSPENRPSSPLQNPLTEKAVVPASSHSELLPRRKTASEPMAAYEPMSKSQERRGSLEVRSDLPVREEDDDDELLRRRRANNRKKAGLQSLNAISIVRPAKKTADVEVPLTSSEKQKTQADAYIAQCHRTGTPDVAPDEEETIKDSQDKNLPSGPKQSPISDDDSTQSDNGDLPEPVVDLTPIPEPKLPAAPSRRSGNHVEPPALVIATSRIPATSPPRARLEVCEAEQPIHQPPAPVPEPAVSHSTPPALSTRSTRANPGPRPVSSSDLSSIASTPAISTVSNRASVSERSPLETSVADNSSPAATKTRRKSAREKVARPKVSTESLRHSTRLESRRGSSSTDELARALSMTPAFDQSLRVSRLFTTSASRSTSRPGRLSTKSPIRQPISKIFDGMAFAISFQSKKPCETNDQYKSRMEFSTALEKRITQAGGKVLANGFDELFEPFELSSGKSVTSTPVASPGKGQVSSEIQLTTAGYATGFTALIADGHSRKVKYMQALALGLPCIAPRWVTMCLDKEELVDWSPFLLCAGQSAFLGDAIRSRSLTPYDPATARLAEVVGQRTKLLQGSRILAVVKKSVESKKMAYVFLARVLGASLTRAYSVDEAKVAVKAAEEAGQPFDWVYVDGKSAEQALFSTGSTTGGTKKRKRASMPARGTENNEPPLKKIRTLDDELVIQSLILGRLIEEGEMEQ
ncbi:putative DNA repair protein [Triangularia setosa]|uniref:DNA repair protein n=1 Tax=Triangularia setosa TaxID=2587417 RepID=A0AAN7A848_9PEZI|nr:putative DNA repair protein [Podospora setosa]